LEVDDGLRACQAPCETGIVPLGEGEFGCQRVGFDGFAAALARNQRAEGTGVALPAPVGEGRGVDALAAQNAADATGFSGAIGLGKNAQLVPGGECPPARTIRQFG
jgi:hypothetical protein